LFGVLGWDIDNRQGFAEPYKEVIHEDTIKIGSATKAPDYSFRIGGLRKFFVEAKKPSINVREDVDPAYQLRRYAWSAKLPLSILTDFQEFAVYDCRLKPLKTDKSSTARINYITYTDYIPQSIRVIDFAIPSEKSRHDRMVEMVEEMLKLHKQLPAVKTEQEKTVIQRQIDATDKQIDRLVYELYGLTEDETKIVEGSVS
jgi:hypothetical protein